MLREEIIDACSEIYIKHKNTFCRQNIEGLNVKTSGT